MKVLLVDDEAAIVEVFSEALKTAGFDVFTASNGNEGLAKARSQSPDIILLDQILPDINGNEILHALKQDPTTVNIPVAIVSNFTQDTMIQDAINNGAVDYLMKYQISSQDLVVKVNQIIHEHGKKANTVNTPQSAS